VVSAIEALQARLDSLESDYKGKCAELELFHDSHDAALAKLAAQPSESPKTYMQGYSDGKAWAEGQMVPLTDEQIDSLWESTLTELQTVQRRVLARVIEAAHKIGGSV
jgi:hypothetical protein